MAWLMVGLCNCFLLIGVLLPVARYVNVTFLVFDVAMVCIRSFIEFWRLHQLKINYDKIFTTEEFKYAFGEHWKFASKKLIVSIFNTMGILVAATMTAFIIIHPLVPLISASLMVTVTLLSYIGNKILEKQKPLDKFNFAESDNSLASSNYLFFSEKNLAKQTPPSISSALTSS
jgi:hypothetical protein